MTDPVPDLAAAAERAAHFIAEADAIVIGAGAGMGVDSGLPDFRGPEGFWRAYPALGRARIAFERAASPVTMRRDPRLGWGFYGHRLQLYRDTVPHEGFALLHRWALAKPRGAFVFTSNVDGQFQKAGFDASRIHECHGSIHWLQCLAPCSAGLWPAADRLPGDLSGLIDSEACRWVGELPACPLCEGLARPNILMFDDYAWIARQAEEQESALEAWLSRAERPVVIEIGAGSQIPSVRRYSRAVQRTRGARLVRINPREWAVDADEDAALAVGALEGLKAIEMALKARAG